MLVVSLVPFIIYAVTVFCSCYTEKLTLTKILIAFIYLIFSRYVPLDSLIINCVLQSCTCCKCCFAINGGIIWLAGCQLMLCGMLYGACTEGTILISASSSCVTVRDQ